MSKTSRENKDVFTGMGKFFDISDDDMREIANSVLAEAFPHHCDESGRFVPPGPYKPKRYVYFVCCPDNQTVKIGVSKKPKQRFNQLKVSCPLPLHLALFYEGDEDEEFRLHMRFKKYRKQGEWFDYSEEIESYVKGYQAALLKSV